MVSSWWCGCCTWPWSRCSGGWHSSRGLARRRPSNCSSFVTRSRSCAVRSAGRTCRGRTGRCCPGWRGCCPAGCGSIAWSPLPPCCRGIVVVASRAGPAALDVSEPARPSTGQRPGAGSGGAAGPAESGLGTPAYPGRAARAGASGRRRQFRRILARAGLGPAPRRSDTS